MLISEAHRVSSYGFFLPSFDREAAMLNGLKKQNFDMGEV